MPFINLLIKTFIADKFDYFVDFHLPAVDQLLVDFAEVHPSLNLLICIDKLASFFIENWFMEQLCDLLVSQLVLVIDDFELHGFIMDLVFPATTHVVVMFFLFALIIVAYIFEGLYFLFLV